MVVENANLCVRVMPRISPLLEIIAKVKFANAHRKANRKIGLEIVNWKRKTGIHGCPLPLENPEEKGYAL